METGHSFRAKDTADCYWISDELKGAALGNAWRRPSDWPRNLRLKRSKFLINVIAPTCAQFYKKKKYFQAANYYLCLQSNYCGFVHIQHKLEHGAQSISYH